MFCAGKVVYATGHINISVKAMRLVHRLSSYHCSPAGRVMVADTCGSGWEEPGAEPWWRPRHRGHLHHDGDLDARAPAPSCTTTSSRAPGARISSSTSITQTSSAPPRSQRVWSSAILLARPCVPSLSWGVADSFLVLWLATEAVRGVRACLHWVFFQMWTQLSAYCSVESRYMVNHPDRFFLIPTNKRCKYIWQLA